MQTISRLCFFLLLVSISSIHANSSNTKESNLIQLVQDSLAKAEIGESKLSGAVLSIEGMSSPKVRHLLNNLCSQPDVHYLEIGCWKGSTLISALYGNVIDAIAIDNWSELGCQRNAFFSNVNHFIPHSNLKVCETDCFSMDKNIFSSKINVYFYDGNHAETSQESAFTYFNDVLDDVFVTVVDDWNWECVRNGTLSAFKKLNYRVLFEKAFNTARCGDVRSWWNGIYIAVIQKQSDLQQ